MTEAPPPAPLPSEPARQGVRSVETGLALLTALAEAGRPMALADLARAAGMAPAKAHRYLVSLIRAGMAERREPGSRYDLGPAALSLGLAALGRLDRQGLTEAALVELRDALDETVCVAAWANRGPTILRMEQASRSVAVNVRIGSVLSPLRSASGRVFVAWLAEARADPATAADRASLGWTEAELEHLVAGVRADGIARVEGAQLPGVSAVSAPVFDHAGRAVFALTALGPSGAFDSGRDGLTARALAAAARRLSARFGHTPATPGALSAPGPKEGPE